MGGGDSRSSVTLRAITSANRRDVEALRVASAQERFVPGVADSLADAAALPEFRLGIELSTQPEGAQWGKRTLRSLAVLTDSGVVAYTGLLRRCTP